LPYAAGDLLDELHKTGSVKSLEYEEGGARVSAAAPRHLVGRLRPHQLGGPGDSGAPASAVGSFEDVGDGSLWVESGGGWSDGDEDEEEGPGRLGVGGYYGVEALALELEGEEEDAELAAAARLLENGGAGAELRDLRQRRRRRRGGSGSGSGADEEGSRRLFAHRLPPDWDEVVYAGDERAVAAALF
jgi:hypothetical protein